MKKTLIYTLSIILNIGLYFFLQIAASFVQFGLFGSGNTSTGAAVWVSLCFVFLQVIILFFSYKKKVFMQDKTLLILNILITVCLFLYFGVYLSNT